MPESLKPDKYPLIYGVKKVFFLGMFIRLNAVVLLKIGRLEFGRFKNRSLGIRSLQLYAKSNLLTKEGFKM